MSPTCGTQRRSPLSPTAPSRPSRPSSPYCPSHARSIRPHTARVPRASVLKCGRPLLLFSRSLATYHLPLATFFRKYLIFPLFSANRARSRSHRDANRASAPLRTLSVRMSTFHSQVPATANSDRLSFGLITINPQQTFSSPTLPGAFVPPSPPCRYVATSLRRFSRFFAPYRDLDSRSERLIEGSTLEGASGTQSNFFCAPSGTNQNLLQLHYQSGRAVLNCGRRRKIGRYWYETHLRRSGPQRSFAREE